VPTALGHSVGSVFDMQDEAQNTALRRGVGSAFTTNAVVKYESDIDSSALELIETIKTNPEFDIFETLQFFQMDFLTKIAFSKNFGNLKEQRDVWGVGESLSNRIHHWLSWHAIPQLEYYLFQHPFWCRFWKTPASSRWVAEALHLLNARLEAMAGESDLSASTTSIPKRDLLQQYIDAAHKRKDIKPATLGLISKSILPPSSRPALRV
jgi:cytochrome P450